MRNKGKDYFRGDWILRLNVGWMMLLIEEVPQRIRWFVKEDGDVSFRHHEFQMLLCHLGGAYSGNAGLEFIRKRELQAAENKGIGLRCPQSLAQLTGASLSPNTFSSARGTLEKKKSLDPSRMCFTADYRFTLGAVIHTTKNTSQCTTAYLRFPCKDEITPEQHFAKYK